jgi:excisionase family DNA binding protein
MLSTSAVAVLAKCSARTVRRAIEAGELAADKPGRDWLVAEAEGKQWADSYRPGPFGPKRGAHVPSPSASAISSSDS